MKKALSFSVLLQSIILLTSHCSAQLSTGSPGLSASLEYSNFDSMREPILYGILSLINGLSIPDISFNGGYINSNELYVDLEANDLTFQPIEEMNAIFFYINNVTMYFKSSKFSYSLLSVPINGKLQANITGASFGVTVQINRVLNPKNRLLPQLNITNVTLSINPSQMTLNLGGNILLSVANVVIPIIEKVLIN